jgi:hypothetical protein
MNSYLSFRYLNSKNEIHFLFKYIYPHFQNFFQEISNSKKQQDASLRAVFNKHYMVRNKQRRGILSPLINLYAPGVRLGSNILIILSEM